MAALSQRTIRALSDLRISEEDFRHLLLVIETYGGFHSQRWLDQRGIDATRPGYLNLPDYGTPTRFFQHNGRPLGSALRANRFVSAHLRPYQAAFWWFTVNPGGLDRDRQVVRRPPIELLDSFKVLSWLAQQFYPDDIPYS